MTIGVPIVTCVEFGRLDDGVESSGASCVEYGRLVPAAVVGISVESERLLLFSTVL